MELVERLRGPHINTLYMPARYGMEVDRLRMLCLEAADRIEQLHGPAVQLVESQVKDIVENVRLRAESIRLRSYNEGLAKIAAQQDEQIERLRAALTRIRDRADKDPSVEAEEALNEIGHVADEALEQREP